MFNDTILINSNKYTDNQEITTLYTHLWELVADYELLIKK